MIRRTVVGLGSNLGDRQANIEGAIAAVAALPCVALLSRSSIWETEPIGGPPQPHFYNAAVLLAHGGDPLELLDHLLRIESTFGRTRTVPNAPRTLDLDILWAEGVSLRGPRLCLPHPRLHERAFALAPLLDVAPDASDPDSGTPYATVFASLAAAGIRRQGPPLDASRA